MYIQPTFSIIQYRLSRGMIELAGRTLARVLPNLPSLCFVPHAANGRAVLRIRLAGCFPRRAKYRRRLKKRKYCTTAYSTDNEFWPRASWRENATKRDGERDESRTGDSRAACKERSGTKSGEHIWHADSSAHLSLFLPESKLAAAVKAVARGREEVNRERGTRDRGWRGHGRRLTVTLDDVARLASARVSVSEACNDDGRTDTANQSAHYTNSIDVVVDPDVVGRPLDNRRVALASSLILYVAFRLEFVADRRAAPSLSSK